MKCVEIFKTNVSTSEEADQVINAVKKVLPQAQINFDLDDCDKILRVEGISNPSGMIVNTVMELGYYCEAIPDKVCTDSVTSLKDSENSWNHSFNENKAIWGFEPSGSAVLAKELFLQNGVKEILIPGFGYGRNAALFIKNNIEVTGIELSGSAIELAKEYYGNDVKVFHGSVTSMPFEKKTYDGIFCYGLLYLLNAKQRLKFIKDCYNQLKPGGWMVFSVVSKKSVNYGKGRSVGKDTFEAAKGIEVFFYDVEKIKEDFEHYGLYNYFEIEEPANPTTTFSFLWISCNKKQIT
jgi:SAM-dependent methyltransferase